MSKESKLMKNTVIIAIGNICTKCISFFMMPLYTSMLSTEEYGTVDLIGTYVSLLAAILTLQFEQGVFRYLIEARQEAEKQKAFITTSLFTVVMMNVAFGIFLTPILLMLHYQYTYFLVIWVIATSLNAIILQIPRGLGNNAIYAFGSFLSGSLNVVLNVVFVAGLRWGVIGMLLACIISLVVSVIYIFIRLKLWKFIRIKCFYKSSFKQLTSYSLPLVPNTLCWWVVNASDRVIINAFINTAANGVYSAACKFPSVFSMASNIFQMAWTESAAENVTQKDSREYFQAIINSSIRFYSSCNILFISVLPFVFNILIKADFTEAYVYIPILMTGALFHSIANLYGSVYTALKMTKAIALTTIASAVVNFTINILFVKNIGLYAAAISTLASYIIITLWRHFDIQRKMRIKIPLGYLVAECIVYVLTFSAYYSRNKIIEFVLLVLIIPYCIYQNKKFLSGMIKTVRRKLSRS